MCMGVGVQTRGWSGGALDCLKQNISAASGEEVKLWAQGWNVRGQAVGGAEVSPFLAALQCPLGKVGLLKASV